MKQPCIFVCLSLIVVFAKSDAEPVITRQPADQSVSLGATAKFQVSATSTISPVLFQWRFATTNLATATSFSLTLTDIQMTNSGYYDAVLTDGSGSVTSRLAHLEVDPTFTKITIGDIVNEKVVGLGIAWGDYDDDGFIDLLVTTAFNSVNGTAQKNILFHNNRDGTFTKPTNSVVASEARDWRGCAWADYDNDGKLDLFVTSTDANGVAAQNELFRNNGDGMFTKMMANSVGAIASVAGGSEGCVWADYDADGFVDMFIARYSTDWLFHNNGDGTFAKMTNTVVGLVADDRDSYGTMWADYDNDGWPDLFVAVKDDTGRNQTNFFYHNNGGGTFTRIKEGAIATDNEHSFYGLWADYDNDGQLDLFVVNGISATNSLYHNNGDGTFNKMTSNAVGSIVGDVASFVSGAWGDYDNDGWLDCFVVNGGDGTNPGTQFLYHNNGDGSFTRVLSGSLVNDTSFGGACAWPDYDNDGFLDLFVTRGAPHAPATNLLYRNNGNSNAWMKIKLVGTVSNRSAIGAKVRVKATIRGRTFWQLREINTGNGFASSPLEAHFGLGDAPMVDIVRIEWPSGIVQTMTNVATKQFLTIVEHQDSGTASPVITSVSQLTNGAVNLSVAGDTGLLYVLDASTNLVNWTKVCVSSNATGIVELTDARTRNYPKRFYRVSVP